MDIEDVVLTILEEDVPEFAVYDLRDDTFDLDAFVCLFLAWIGPQSLDPEYIAQNKNIDLEEGYA